MLVGRRLKELRRVFGITQQELGNILNVTKATICCYEKETRTPTLENLIDLSDYFEVTIDYLLGRDYLVRDNKTGKNIFISKEQYESTNLTPNALQGE
ncbi:MAG: helix-turn-helix transcriptional regulator, partial [Bacilli bacterium]|nr:helix-turn-helix transcriptional regulator [Bacilli bacterium]